MMDKSLSTVYTFFKSEKYVKSVRTNCLAPQDVSPQADHPGLNVSHGLFHTSLTLFPALSTNLSSLSTKKL